MSLDRTDWELWRSFLAVLRHGSLAGAARALGVAHPTVRRHLEEIEASAGGRLFLRSPAGLLPTETALAMREAAEAMEAAAAALLRAAASGPRKASGTVRLTASEVIGVEVLPPMLAAIRERHSAIQVELVLTNAVDNLLRHDADVAIRMARPSQADLVARRLGAVELGLYGHRDWLAAHGEPADLPGAASAGALIGQDRGTSVRLALEALGIRVGPAAFGFRSDSDLAQLAALRAGLGIGVCQLPIAERDPALRRVLPAYRSELPIWLVTHPGLREQGRVRAVFDALASLLAGYVGQAGRRGQAAAIDRS